MSKLDKMHNLLKDYDKSGKRKKLKRLKAKIEAYESDPAIFDAEFDYSVLTAAQLDKLKAEAIAQIEAQFAAGDYEFIKLLPFHELSAAKQKAFRKMQLDTYKSELLSDESELDAAIDLIRAN